MNKVVQVHDVLRLQDPEKYAELMKKNAAEVKEEEKLLSLRQANSTAKQAMIKLDRANENLEGQSKVIAALREEITSLQSAENQDEKIAELEAELVEVKASLEDYETNEE